jgi:D-mannonate dehydratase
VVKYSIHSLTETKKNLVTEISVIEKGKYAKTDWVIQTIKKRKKQIADIDFSIDVLKKYVM